MMDRAKRSRVSSSEVAFNRVVLRKRDLNGLSQDEQQLVAASLIIQNEIGILLSCARMAYPRSHGQSDSLLKARSSQTFFFLIMLAGKLNEAWALLAKQHIGRPHFERLNLTLGGPARRALDFRDTLLNSEPGA
jgi:hypothetical protein